MKTTVFEKLTEIKNNFPSLTFDNNGYQYIKPEIREQHKEQIKEIEEILNSEFVGIVKFNNFKPRKDGSFSIRCQCKYDESFTGVVYLNKEDFKKQTVQIL